MPQVSKKITEFPGTSDAMDNVAPLPTHLFTQDKDPTQEIHKLIEGLQEATRDARRRQRQAEEERDQLRGEMLDLREEVYGRTETKAIIRERDMLLEQQAQYGPVISDLKQRLQGAEAEMRAALAERDTALRERKQSHRLVEEAERKCKEALKQRDGAIRQCDLSKEERDEAMAKTSLAQKNFSDAQKAIAESQKTIAGLRQDLDSVKKKGVGELASQLGALRQARDGMAAQINELKQRIGELEDELAEAGYAREAAEKTAGESHAQITEMQGLLEAAAMTDSAQKIEALEAGMFELQTQLAAATECNRHLAESEAALKNEIAGLRRHGDSSPGDQTGNPAALGEAHASLMAAQKQIDAIIRDRDTIKEQLSANAITLEAKIREQSAEMGRLRMALRDKEGSLSERSELEAQFESRRLDIIELTARLENAHRDIRSLSASLAEARLHAKLAGRNLPDASGVLSAEVRTGAPQAPASGHAEITAMRRCYQTFSRDQKQLGMLGEMETYACKISHQAMLDGRPILHRVGTAFASLLGDLLEVPDQISQASLRTLNQTIEFIALQLSDPEIEGSIKLGDARVYVVDDDKNACAMVVEALNLVGLQTNYALYSSAAVAELSANSYDLILLDVHLPELDGFELCSHIRNMERHAETPIFFVTGDTSLENRVKSSLRGGNEFIAKPFSIQEIALKALKAVITGQLHSR